MKYPHIKMHVIVGISDVFSKSILIAIKMRKIFVMSNSLSRR